MEDPLVSLLVGQGNRFQRHLLSARLLDQFQSVIENGQGRQAQKIHLQQAHLFDGDHVEGSNNFLVLGLIKGDQLGQRPRRDHDTGGVHASVAHQTLKLLSCIQQFPHLGVALINLLHERRFLQCLLQRDVKLVGNHLGDAIHIGIRYVHGAAHILDRRLSRHGAEGDDLGDILAPVLAGDVIDDFATPVHAEVDVDIRHGHALGIQEALEQQLVLQGIKVGDAHRVGDQRAGCRAAARTNRNVALLRVTDEVPHNEKVP